MRDSPARESSLGYLPTLDGWRAIAIIAVIFHHSALLTAGQVSTQWLYAKGNAGVNVFFAISGLLICTRLLEEESRTGRLHLPGFYLRRVLRIQPASLLFLLAVLLLKLAGRIPLSNGGFFAALFLVRDYLPWHAQGATDFATLHFWSLSVEEQFYLILPLFLLLVKRWRAAVLSGCSLGLALWGTYATRHSLITGQGYHRADFIFPQLLIPAACAVLLRRRAFAAAVKRWLVPAVGVSIAFAIWIPIWLNTPHMLKSLDFLAPTVLVVSTMLHPDAWLSRVLEWGPLRFVGKISFGLYLWQELFFTGHFAPDLHPFPPLMHFPVNLVAVFALAVASYYLVERPCMRLGHRLAKPAVAGRPELATP